VPHARHAIPGAGRSTEQAPIVMTVLKPLPMRAGCVLVVDDEENNRTLLRDTLERRNYEVVEAEDGAAALAFIKKRSPDVILLDLMMPGMDGFVVCREIKRNPATAAIPVLM